MRPPVVCQHAEHGARLQDVRNSGALFKAFQEDMRDLVAEVKARGPPAPEDVTVAAHLLRLRDPQTGAPLGDDLLASEFAVIYAAGLESAANALTWTMWAPSRLETCSPHCMQAGPLCPCCLKYSAAAQLCCTCQTTVLPVS